MAWVKSMTWLSRLRGSRQGMADSVFCCVYRCFLRACIGLCFGLLMLVLSTLAPAQVVAVPLVHPPAHTTTAAAVTPAAHGYDSWSQAAQEAVAYVSSGQEAYARGDAVEADSDFSAALSTSYTASNLAVITAQRLGVDRRSHLDQLFRSLLDETYMPNQAEHINQLVQELSVGLMDTAQELDRQAGTPKPREYAKQLEQQIQRERQQLDASKKHSNAGRGEKTWTQVAQEMTVILDDAYKASAAGDGAQGSTLVNKAYYQYYEKLGFEKNVMNAISGSRVSEVEYQFKQTRMAMSAGKDVASVKPLVSDLKTMLVVDAQTLDGGAARQVSGFTSFITSAFGQAFIVLLREGLEAILVVAAIIAYLVKSGHKDKVQPIYWGIVAGLFASCVVALLFTLLFHGNGPQQEILEGVVALIAMVMLLYTSNWMLSKSSVTSWNQYIKAQTVAAISRGSILSLALLSFLAVFREGAETVMFYQAIIAMAPSGHQEIWAGFAVATVVLVLIFVLIRFTSVNIPIRPFFIITSALMAVMVVIFAGGGVHALIEGDLIPASYVPGLPTSDWLGFYPYKESIGAQILAIVAVLVLFIVSLVMQSGRSEVQKAAASQQVVSHP